MREGFLDQVLRVVLLHLDFFQDDALLFAQVLFPEQRLQHQVGQDVQGSRQVLIHHLGVEANDLLGGEGVHVPTHGVQLFGDLLGAAAGGALEDSVLDEVADPVHFRGLGPRAALHPNAHRHRAHVRHLLGQDRQPVGERLLAHTSNVGGHNHLFTLLLRKPARCSPGRPKNAPCGSATTKLSCRRWRPPLAFLSASASVPGARTARPPAGATPRAPGR